jgi:hypothetical protein
MADSWLNCPPRRKNLDQLLSRGKAKVLELSTSLARKLKEAALIKSRAEFSTESPLEQNL